jgi:hypothetical protein
MARLVKLVGYFIFLCGIIVSTAYATTITPIGQWKTIDDVTGRARSILSIWEAPDHSLLGKLEKIYPDPGKEENGLCTACNGADHNRPLIGLTIMWGLELSKDGEWKGGRIMDPKTGKVYRVNIMVVDGGNKLKVHGYIGLPIFGRTQMWARA